MPLPTSNATFLPGGPWAGAKPLAPRSRGGGLVLGLGALAVGAGIATIYGATAAAHEARYSANAWRRAEESQHMTKVLSTMQVGPFGTGARPYGMGSNHSNSAGMSLALHYARNGTGIKNPAFSMAGLVSPRGRLLGRML